MNSDRYLPDYPQQFNKFFIISHCCVSSAPINRYHLLQVPPVGGTPIILRLAIKKAAMVIGICCPRPRISLIFDLWVATRMAPAQKNSVILPKACIAICIELPTTPAEVASKAPMVI